MLTAYLIGKSRAAILAALVIRPETELHLQELARVSGVSPGTAHRELRGLLKHGLVARRKSGRQVYYRANREHPIFGDLRSLLLKTSGLADVMRRAIRPLAGKIRVAFIYGSVAAGEFRTESDIDVLVIGDTSVGQITKRMIRPERELGRRISAVTYSAQDWRRKLAAANTFARTVTNGPKIFLKGDERDLAELA